MPVNQQELTSNLLQTMKSNGTYTKLEANVLSEIFKHMNENSAQKVDIPEINVIINSLIFDYLNFNQLEYSSKTLKEESGQDNYPDNFSSQTATEEEMYQKSMSRVQLGERLNVDGSLTKPLLYGLIQYFLDGRQPK